MSRLNKNVSISLFFLALLLPLLVQASNNRDSPAAANDPIADITQLYAFVSPSCELSGSGCTNTLPEELILAITLAPTATETTLFSEAVVYHIYFENDVGVDSQIDCSVSAEQVITCAGLNGLSVSAPVGEIGVNGDIRVFAGLRDDPRFADEDALIRFSQIGVQAFNAPGIDTIAGSNTLAIVIGIKYNSLPAGSGATDTNGHTVNIQKTWVASERIESSINAGVSGAWYNRDQGGQGWVIELLKTPSGSHSFVFYFYGYDDQGENLWLLGITDETNSSTFTVDALRFNGTGHGGSFDPDDLTNESVGTMTFEFSDCNTGTVDFVPDNSDLSAYAISVTRLTNIASTDCVFSSEGQVDRRGRPFTSLMIAEEQRDAYNAASDPDTWNADYGSALEAALVFMDNADGQSGNSLNPPAEIAPILVDDRLKVDMEWARCNGVWGLELSMLVPQPNTNDCGGRMLDYDYIEEFFGMTISGFDPLIDDFVTANDVPFLTEFPFLAAPH